MAVGVAGSGGVDLRSKTFVPLAVGLPLAFWIAHHGVGHAGDIGFFHEWYLAFREGPAFYRDGPGINYPIVGALLVCGPATLVEAIAGAPLDLGGFRVVLKATLVAGEIAFVFASAALAGALGARRPRAFALALWALPSTWAVGAWFGQVDVWGSALLITSAWGLVRYRQGGARHHLVAGLVALHAALLCKQLTWFAAPGLGLLATLGLLRHADRSAWALALLSPLLWLVPDLFVTLPEGFRSHLWFILTGGGSDHGQLAVASGASLWALVAPGGTPADAIRFAGLDSFAWGWLAWTAAMGAGLVRVRSAELSNASLVALAGIGHLAMAVLLTGVHERYLAHAVPLLLLADARGPAWRNAIGHVTGVLGGLFVVATIEPAWFAGPLVVFAHPAPLALTSAGWLLASLAARPRPLAQGVQSTSSASKLR